MKKIKLMHLDDLYDLTAQQIINTSVILENKQNPEKIIGLSLDVSNLSEEALQQLESLIPQYQNVQKVTIEKVQHIPNSILGLPSLQELVLSCEHPSQEMIAGFKECTVLKRIVWHNLRSLPSSFYEYTPKLEELWFKYSTLDEIPESIAQLKELKLMMFERCKIRKVSSNVFTLPKLKAIDLRSLGIEEITPLTGLVQVSRLREINLSHNVLKSFPAGLLENLPKLKELWIVGNKITELPEEQIAGKNYERIDLTNNALKVFPGFILEQVKKISFFVLKDNQIKEIPENIFALARQKKCFVKLENNLIETVSQDVEKDVEKHRGLPYPPPRIDIKDNPFFVRKEEIQNTTYRLLIEKQVREGTCVEIASGEYRGSGVLPEEHPLKNRISFRQQCGKCNSKNIFITYAKFTVHLMSGDVYWDYNYHCNKCGEKDDSSYAENN